MKNLIITALLLLTVTTYAQKETTTVKVNDSKITSLIFTVDNLNELKTINWKDIKDMVKENKPTDSIALGFRVRSKDKSKRVAYDNSIVVKGKSEDIDDFIKINKRFIKVFENL
ncbi:hypothetical protein WH52_14460 [Tenacibaculum holothuriorum]|uniref:Uncharacterized protein n=1 Tax=Tenacibaculum holothuriorum TaxID=1635173 RepID=A0A1Y2PAT3_9FLAO|nr:hypothetical protein [Tenacibaculum holothuriorum]OSY86879.1 hypothetical protein WH52_14460 [Tenacibaculum holothuriorum]